MPWIFLAESAETPSLCAVSQEPSPTVNGTATLKVCSSHEWLKGFSQEPPSGTTYPPSTDAPCAELSSSWSPDSHAKTSLLLDVETAWRESEAAYSSRSSASSRKYAPVLSFSRTFLRSAQEDLQGYCASWPSFGMIVGGQLSLPQKLEPHTKGTAGSCLLPTPTAARYGTSNNGDPGDGRGKYATKGKLSLWSMAAKGLWPTPAAQDAKNSTPPPSQRNRDTVPGALLRAGESPGGQLNPTWVEWLMGLPIGWTELGALGTQWFQPRRAKRSAGSQESQAVPHE